MAASWVTNTIAGYIHPIVSGAVSTAGGFAGDVVSGVGNGINSVGQSIEGTIRGYGDATKTYGNAVKDWTKADGPRIGTATNPLGLGDTAGGGKRAFTHPNKNVVLKNKPAQKSLPAPSQPKALPAPPPKKAPISAPKAPVSASKAPVKPSITKSPLSKPPKPTNTPKAPSTGMPLTPGKKRISPESMSKSRKARREKMSRAERRKAANQPARGGGASAAPAKKWEPTKEAKNPLGL